MKTNKISTPIADFLEKYAKSEFVRLHMPGHKGKDLLGFEKFDITEIKGADSLYEADGIIAESEVNATKLFGTGRTLFSTEGSSQCIRAMMYLVSLKAEKGRRPVVLAARNVHKTFVFAAAMLDIDVKWLWGEEDRNTICSCKVTAEGVRKALSETVADAVYITSPDYLGEMADIKAIADVCHEKGVLLAVDNAHGSYLHFIDKPLHPMDLGADLCCDSAHKTLPALTGCAYLHISKNAPEMFKEQAKFAMALFGSTSPSYLLIASLDKCNAYIADGYRDRLKKTIEEIDELKSILKEREYKLVDSDPLKITVCVPDGMTGEDLADRLREKGIECEYADPDFVVLMATTETDKYDFERVKDALGVNNSGYSLRGTETAIPEKVMTIREAVMSLPETVEVEKAEGRICRVPTVSCPPAIPVAVPGERISKETLNVFKYYGIKEVDDVK